MATKTARHRSAQKSRRGETGDSASWIGGVGSREVSALLLGGTATLLILSLVSYSPQQLPDWVPFARAGGVGQSVPANFVGPIGALVAGYAFFFLGAASFLAPAVLLWWAVQVVSTGERVHSKKFPLLVIFLLSAACLIEYQKVLFQNWVSLYNLPKSAGGLVGYTLGRQIFAHLLGHVGSLFLMSLFYITTLLAITGIHPWRFLILVKTRIVHHWRAHRPLHRLMQWINGDDLQPIPKPTCAQSRRKKQTPDSSRIDKAVAAKLKEKQQKTAADTAPQTEKKSQAKPVTEPQSASSAERERKIIDASQVTQRPRLKPLDFGQFDQEVVTPASEASLSFADYQLPSLDLLSYAELPADTPETDQGQLIALQNTIVDTLNSFNVQVDAGDITKGPTITRFEVYPSTGLRVSKITALKADIARATRAERINILAPIPGKDTVGIEIANSDRIPVALRELFETDAFCDAGAKLPLALGKDVYGNTVIGDLAKMPHLLVAGATGSGKSVCINTIIASLLYRFTPDQLKFIMIDPKVVEMQLYNALPHMVVPVVTEPKKVLMALRWVITEMERRYTWFAELGVRNFEGFNEKQAGGSPDDVDTDESLVQGQLFDDFADEAVAASEVSKAKKSKGSPEPMPDSLPYIVVIIDELADLMQTAPADVETAIARIAQKARAAGIHLIVATQTPRADVVTGIIKANIPSRIAFQVSSKTDSRIILDENGAENLVGKGDMLYLPPGSAQLTRAQGALITDDEAQALVEACASQCPQELEQPVATGAGPAHLGSSLADTLASSTDDAVSDEDEELIERCIDVITTEGRASTSLLQRRLRLGYTRAARMIDILESRGVISPGDGAKPREILIDLSTE